MGGTESAKGDLWYPFNLKHFDNIAATPEAQEKMRTHLIRLTDCENVLIQGVTVENSPKFHIVPQRCKNVIIDGVTVRCPWNAQNGDAIDIGNCTNVLIVNNVIDAGDDGICMKGGAGAKALEYGPCQNINIQDNIVYHAHGGFVIGSEFSGGMKNIYVHNNTFSGTDTGLRFKSSVGRGGTTEDIYISNIYMTDIDNQAIVFETTYFDNHVGAKKGAQPTKLSLHLTLLTST
jgi:polygalacturonase